MIQQGFCIEVSGPYACFTRPEMKVERVSYDAITPSAARAIFEAILWKPAIRWQVSRIEVCEPIRWISVRRNEVSAVVPMGTVKSVMNSGGTLALNIEDNRQQRAGLFLRDVRYRLHGRFEMTDKAGEGDTPAKFAAMFERRTVQGQCFNQPYLGTREFSCRFRLLDVKAEPFVPPPELAGERDLGWMLYDLDFGKPPYADPKPLFFRAKLRRGVIAVPARDSEEVRG
ncbi:type I-C CRISPR-associated protein Cas5c [Dokdonella soli]|uniref:pre-crRNA processing endonuclease n=1 Tax=Dokdonella soli TaxID=529810 RepID=A0ABN1ISQ6_9GAMM